MSINRTRRTLAAFASTAVASAGIALLAPSATAATGSVNFDCEVPILGKTTFAVEADTNLPETVTAGSKVSYDFTAKVTTPDNVRSSAIFFFGQQVTGDAAVTASAGGVASPVSATLPTTAIPTATGPLVLTVAGKGSWTPSGTGAQDVTVSAFTANLTFIKDGVKAATPLTVPCSVATPVVVDTVQVVEATTPPVVTPAASKTTAKVKYSKKSKKATVTTSVKVGKKAASGKVKIKLAKGKKTVKTVTVKLNKSGKATASFKKITKKGKYTATVSYAGSSSVKKSSKKVTFTVK